MKHRCPYPRWHSVGSVVAVVLWIHVGACWLVPKSVYALTHHGALAILSAGLAVFVGTCVVYGLASWRCRPRCRAGQGPSLLMPLAVLAWILREPGV